MNPVPTNMIVVANPWQYMMYSFLTSSAFGYFLMGVIAFFIVFLGLNRLLGGSKMGAKKWKTTTALWSGAVAGFGVMFILPWFI